MDKCYQTDGYHRYIVLSDIEGIPESYEIDMIQNNDIPYLLKPVLNSVDGEYKLYYEVDGIQEYKIDATGKHIDYWQILKLTEDVIRCSYQISEYMLYPDNLLIDLNNIFYDENAGVYRFIYIPGYGKNIRDTLRNLIEGLMKYLNHRDKRGTDYIYTLYEYVSMESFDMDKLLEFLDSCRYGCNINSDNQLQNMGNVSGNIPDNISGNLSGNISAATTGNVWGGASTNISTEMMNNSVGADVVGDTMPYITNDNIQKNNIYKAVLIIAMICSVVLGAALFYSQYSISGHVENVYPLMGILILLLVEIYVFSEICRETEKKYNSGIIQECSEIQLPEYENNKPQYNNQTGEYMLVHKNNCYEAFYFKCSYMVIGRDKDCDYMLDSKSVSRVHARIYMCNNVWVLEDMNSTNGTFVNEYPVAAGYPAVIKQGDVIRFGDEEFVMEYMNNFPAGDLNNCPIANVWY